MKDTKQIAVLKLGDEQYGFPIEQVNEIIRYLVPTKIPNTPAYIEGIISLRDKVHVVIDLRNCLGMTKKVADDNTKIIIANDNNVGFIVDEVNMIVTPKKDEVDTAADLSILNDNNYVLYILKIDGNVIVVLNMSSILDMGNKIDK